MIRQLAFFLLLATRCLAADVEGPYFAPGPDCEQAIVRELNAAKKTIRCQYYGFTDDDIRDALIAAADRHVDVRVILDRSNLSAKYSEGARIAAAKIPTLVDSKHPIAHNKIAIIDGETVVTGSWNASVSASKNAENVIVIRDKDIAEKYTANWKVHAEHSDPWGVRAQNRRTRK